MLITSLLLFAFKDKKDIEYSLLVILVGSVVHTLLSIALVCGSMVGKKGIMGFFGGVPAILSSIMLIVNTEGKDKESELSDIWKGILAGSIGFSGLVNFALVGGESNLHCKKSQCENPSNIKALKNAVRDYNEAKRGESGLVSGISKKLERVDLNDLPTEIDALQLTHPGIIGADGIDCIRYAKAIKEMTNQLKIKGKHAVVKQKIAEKQAGKGGLLSTPDQRVAPPPPPKQQHKYVGGGLFGLGAKKVPAGRKIPTASDSPKGLKEQLARKADQRRKKYELRKVAPGARKLALPQQPEKQPAGAEGLFGL
jgi:hypothetical protein